MIRQTRRTFFRYRVGVLDSPLLMKIFKFPRIALILLISLFACNEEHEPTTPDVPREKIIRIPVVVHVIYNRDEYNISEEKIRSQIAVLNQDFRKRNVDHTRTPAEFAHLVADAGIEFELATTDPVGNATSGITRTQSDIDGWTGNNPENILPIEELKLFFTDKGGRDAWPRDRYLNIWVVELSDRHGRLGGYAGYANFPGSDPRIDGVVIDPRAFGTLDPLVAEHRLGRTATHEIGHWLNLYHTFSNRTCEGTDYVDDTPTTADSHHGNPSYPQYSCGQSSMFMNFMDYVDDESMYMFTEGQKERMRALFLPGGARRSFCRDCQY